MGSLYGDVGIDGVVVMSIGMLCVRVGRRKWEKKGKKCVVIM